MSVSSSKGFEPIPKITYVDAESQLSQLEQQITSISSKSHSESDLSALATNIGNLKSRLSSLRIQVKNGQTGASLTSEEASDLLTRINAASEQLISKEKGKSSPGGIAAFRQKQEKQSPTDEISLPLSPRETPRNIGRSALAISRDESPVKIGGKGTPTPQRPGSLSPFLKRLDGEKEAFKNSDGRPNTSSTGTSSRDDSSPEQEQLNGKDPG